MVRRQLEDLARFLAGAGGAGQWAAGCSDGQLWDAVLIEKIMSKRNPELSSHNNTHSWSLDIDPIQVKRGPVAIFSPILDSASHRHVQKLAGGDAGGGHLG